MKKILLFLVAVIMTVALNAQSKADLKFWEPTIEAISKVESRQNPKAVSKSGRYVGYLQISQVLIKDINDFFHTKYTSNDRYNVQKSKEMFVLIQKKYNPEKNIQKAIRIWSGGCNGLKNRSTLAYYNRVMKQFNLTAYNLPDSL